MDLLNIENFNSLISLFLNFATESKNINVAQLEIFQLHVWLTKINE